ncbi:hypothetical protein QYF36_003450 [Acer negundo]|nr:hypothetical protein QYF36_003450 [Acer negundo]
MTLVDLKDPTAGFLTSDICIIQAQVIILGSVAVEWVNSSGFGSLNHAQIIFDIRSRLDCFGQASVVHCSRASNSVADNLLKMALSWHSYITLNANLMFTNEVVTGEVLQPMPVIMLLYRVKVCNSHHVLHPWGLDLRRHGGRVSSVRGTSSHTTKPAHRMEMEMEIEMESVEGRILRGRDALPSDYLIKIKHSSLLSRSTD